MSANPFTIPIPADLDQIIQTHRALFGGFTMMADEQQDAPPPADSTDDTQRDAGDLGDAGKKAIDTERKARRDAERRAKAAEDELAKRDEAGKSDTERLTSAHSTEKQARETAEARAVDAERKLAVYLNSGDGDPARLLKHTDFLAAIAQVEPGDTDAIKTAIADAVKAEPWLKRGAVSGGDRGAGHQALPENVRPGVARLAAAFEQATTR